MNKRGFTLVEVLVCIGIIGILVAILLPVITRAKRHALISVSLGRLHQFHLALKMYQADYDGDGRYGSPAEMGFPPQRFLTLNRFDMSLDMWASPCGNNPQLHEIPMRIGYLFFPYRFVERRIPEIALKYKENLATFIDMNCSDDYEPLDNPQLRHHGLGVLLSGQLLNLNKPGLFQRPDWWAQPVY